ncbi:hypothetical protein SK128_018101 [Halocaridina rubra]|uniref:BRCA1-associated RING domain protein 1 n=1 Tax=Halocaridina rubra TaxID=373956 RepID=A0AAN8X870_HALRR
MDGDVLKLIQWNNSLEAIKELENLLLCCVCKSVAEDAKCLGRCEHFFCAKCVSTLENGICPACSIPSPPCEMQPDRIIASLVSSVKDLRHLLDGGEITCVEQGIEAPCTPKSHTKPSKSVEAINKPKMCKKLDKSAEKGGNISQKKSSQLQSKKDLNTSKAKSKPSRSNGVKSSTSKSSLAPSFDNKAVKNSTDSKIVPVTPDGKKIRKLVDLSALGLSPGGPSVNKRNAKGESMLHIACIKGDVEKVKSLLLEGANPNTKDNAGWTPLHETCSHGFYNIAELLLQHGALVDVPGGESEENPLHDAITQGQIELVKLLRCWGASDTARNLYGNTPRSLASLCMGADKLHAALDTPFDCSLKRPSFMLPYLDKMVLLGSGLNPSQSRTLVQLSKMLGARIASEFSPDVTHVVCCTSDRIVVQKTPTYMMGVASGKWILSHTWMDACLSQGKVLSPEIYEVYGSKDLADRDAPCRARINASNMRPGLLKGTQIYLWGSFLEPYRNKKAIETLIKAGDGTVLVREPNPESQDKILKVPYHAQPDGMLVKCSYIILYQDGPVEPQIKYNMEHIKTLPFSWFKKCIENFALLNPLK